MPAEPAVVDASALAAVLFSEPEGLQVASRLGSRALFAPSLIRYELASVCLKKGRQAEHGGTVLRRALGLYSELAVQEVQVPPSELVAVAEQTDLTAYDAAYLWLAWELQLELVTLDAQLGAAEG